jgi:mono/diheme cytochrome c family protein
MFANRLIRLALPAFVAGLALSGSAMAAQAPGGRSQYPDLATGEALYKGICQGCHMPDAKGAVGAGAYPALAGNIKLKVAAYPLVVVTRGQKAMPEFGSSLSDDQIAAVVGYIRSGFGNGYTDAPTPADVARLRPKP